MSVVGNIKIHWSAVLGGLASISATLAAHANELPPKIAVPVTIVGTVLAMFAKPAAQKAQ